MLKLTYSCRFGGKASWEERTSWELLQPGDIKRPTTSLVVRTSMIIDIEVAPPGRLERREGVQLPPGCSSGANGGCIGGVNRGARGQRRGGGGGGGEPCPSPSLLRRRHHLPVPSLPRTCHRPWNFGNLSDLPGGRRSGRSPLPRSWREMLQEADRQLASVLCPGSQPNRSHKQLVSKKRNRHGLLVGTLPNTSLHAFDEELHIYSYLMFERLPATQHRQRSPGWLNARLGVVTASGVGALAGFFNTSTCQILGPGTDLRQPAAAARR